MTEEGTTKERFPFPKVSRVSVELSLQSIVGLLLLLDQQAPGAGENFVRHYLNSLRKMSQAVSQDAEDYRKIADHLEALWESPEFSFYFSSIRGPKM